MNKLLAYLLLNCLYFQAVTSQIAAPVWQFSGTPVEWAKRPNQLYYSNNGFERFSQLNKPIITKDAIYFLLTNAYHIRDEGTTLIKADILTGDTIWQREYSPLGQPENRGYFYFPEFNIKDTIIQLYGYVSIDTQSITGTDLRLTRFPSKRWVSTNTGKDIKHLYNLNFSDRLSGVVSSPWYESSMGDSRLLYYSRHHRDPIDTITDELVPVILDSSMKKIQLDSSKIVKLNIPNSVSILYTGPLLIGKDSFIYFASMQISTDLTWKHFIWKVNQEGEFWDLKELSNIIGGEDLTYFFYREGAEVIKDKIRLKVRSTKTNNLQYNCLPGYLYLDFNGQIVSDYRNLTIDGKHISYISSLDLEDGILHAVRFYSDNNVYLFKEDLNDSFIQVAALINEGPPSYAYCPVGIDLTPDKDVLLSFVVAIDSSFSGFKPLEYGGWPYFCKISGEHIGLKTGVFDEKVAKRLRVYPNPGRGDFYLEDSIIGELTLLDIQGRQVMNKACLGECKIEINYLPDGLYLLKVMDQKNQEVKVCKIFKQSD